MRLVSNYGLPLRIESTFVILHILVESFTTQPSSSPQRRLLAARRARQHGLVADSSSSGGSLLAVRSYFLSSLFITLSEGNSCHARSDEAPNLFPIMIAPPVHFPASEYANKTCTFREAKKIRHKIIRDIEQLKKGSSGKNEEEQLKSLEESMAQYVRSLLARRQKMSHAEEANRPCGQSAQASIGTNYMPLRCWAFPWDSPLQTSTVWSDLTGGSRICVWHLSLIKPRRLSQYS